MPNEVRLPHEPTEVEREQHALCHLPMAPWCAACVASRGARDDPHPVLATRVPAQSEEVTMTVVQLDHSFLDGLVFLSLLSPTKGVQ